MDFSRILHAGGDNIFGVLVFIVIVVVNIIKFVKKGEQTQPPQDTQDLKRESSQDELKAFLESLSGTKTVKPQSDIIAKQTTQVPYLQPKKVTNNINTTIRQKKKTATPPPVAINIPSKLPPAINKRKATNITSNPSVDKVRADLNRKDSLRKAIVLREILGAPVALQGRL